MSIFGVGDIGLASYHYDTNTGQPDHYQTTYDSKTKIVVFYSLTDGLGIDAVQSEQIART